MLHGLYKNKTGQSYNWWFGEEGVFGSDSWTTINHAFEKHYMAATSKNTYNKWMPEPVLVIPAEFTANKSSKGEE